MITISFPSFQSQQKFIFFSQDLSFFSFFLFFFKNFSPFSFSDLCFSFSLGAKLLETPRLFPHSFSFPSCRVSLPESLKKTLFFLSKHLIFFLLFQTSLPNSLCSLFSFSLGAKPSETPRIFLPRFQFSSYRISLPRFLKKSLFPNVPLFLKTFQTSILSIRTTPFSFPFNFRNPHLQPWNPNSFSSHLLEVSSCPSLLHNSLPAKNPHGFKVGCNQPEKWPKLDIKPSS